MNYKVLYDTLPDYKAFVDKSCNSYGYTVEEALKMATIREAGNYYATKETNAKTTTRIDVGCGGGC